MDDYFSKSELNFLNQEFKDDGELDPVLRCDSCNKIIQLDRINKLGCCEYCGNKRVRALTIFNKEEYDQIKAWGFDDFLKKWEVVDD